MQNPISIRKHGLAGMTLIISLLWAFPDVSTASIGDKPLAFRSDIPRKHSPSEASSESPRRKLFAGLFSKRLTRSREERASRQNRTAWGQTLCQVRTTAYTHEEADHQPYGRSTAIGTTLRCSQSYTSAAADWSRFPLGTAFQIVGEPTIYVIDDCGGALYGTNTIDIYRPNMAAMNAWGTRHVQIKILQRAQQAASRKRS